MASATERNEQIEDALATLERYLDVARESDRRALAEEVYERFSGRESKDMTDDEFVLLQAVRATYEREANFEESAKRHDEMIERMRTDDRSVEEKIQDLVATSS